MGSGITVVIPTIPIRPACLMQAQFSAWQNTLKPDGFSIALDVDKRGAAPTRNRALASVHPRESPWVAFLDDDDEMYPNHLQDLYNHAMETGADFVYSWFDMEGGKDPFPETHFTDEFDPANPIETTITTLVRTELAQAVGFYAIDERQFNSGEDYNFVLGCIKAGASIKHLAKRTWRYNIHGKNTSGLPTNW